MKKVTVTEIAEMLGVPRQRVTQWHMRRARNGFPQPVDRRPYGTPGVPGYRSAARVWDADAVKKWHDGYVPSKGGRPRVASRVTT